jgi:hypothetical protein
MPSTLNNMYLVLKLEWFLSRTWFLGWFSCSSRSTLPSPFPQTLCPWTWAQQVLQPSNRPLVGFGCPAPTKVKVNCESWSQGVWKRLGPSPPLGPGQDRHCGKTAPSEVGCADSVGIRARAAPRLAAVAIQRQGGIPAGEVMSWKPHAGRGGAFPHTLAGLWRWLLLWQSVTSAVTVVCLASLLAPSPSSLTHFPVPECVLSLAVHSTSLTPWDQETRPHV